MKQKTQLRFSPDNLLLSYWINKNGDYILPSCRFDTMQRWWKPFEERRVKEEEKKKIIEEFNKSLGVIFGILDENCEMFTYKREILVIKK